MIISRTPFRVSFFGGGTDYPAWYRQHGGAVLAAAIDKYCYLTCRFLPPFFEHRIRVVYSHIEMVQSADEIKHPAVRAVLKLLNVERGVEVHHDGDLPARSGMGSSSSFTVGLLHALHALYGRMVSKHQLAMEGIQIEQEILKENVGSQDQVMAAYGGLNHVRFLPSGDITVRPVTISGSRMAELESHLMLFYTGIKRTASDVAATFISGMDERRRQLRIMSDLVEEGISLLSSAGDIGQFGQLLHEGWQAKRGLSNMVSNGDVDQMYEVARQAGATGGKLLGAGGGGFLLLFAAPDLHDEIRQKLSRLIHVPFKFEHAGSQIIHFDSETDYSREDQLRTNSRVDAFRELTLQSEESA